MKKLKEMKKKEEAQIRMITPKADNLLYKKTKKKRRKIIE